MLPHRPRHSRHDVVDIGSIGGSSVELDRVVSAGATYEGVYRSTRPGDRLRGVTERAQLSLVSLPIPLLNHNSRQMRPMSAGKRSFSLEGDTSSTSTLAGVDPPSVGPVGLGSPTSPASRKTTKLFAALRRSNSFTHKRSGKNSSVCLFVVCFTCFVISMPCAFSHCFHSSFSVALYLIASTHFLTTTFYWRCLLNRDTECSRRRRSAQLR